MEERAKRVAKNLVDLISLPSQAEGRSAHEAQDSLAEAVEPKVDAVELDETSA